MTKNITTIKDDLSKLTIQEAAELVKVLEEAWGVSANAPVMQAAAPTAAAPTAEAKTDFDVELTEVGANKLEIIKLVRKVTDDALKAAKEKVESAPVILKAAMPKEEAEKIKKEFEEKGAKIQLK